MNEGDIPKAVRTRQDKKNRYAKEICDMLGTVYKPESGLSKNVYEALTSKLSLVELSQLKVLVWTADQQHKDERLK